MIRVPAWLHDVALQQLLAEVQHAGGEARVVGGAVRDAVMGREGGDIDIASTLVPERMMEIAAGSGWKCIPTGIAHGTVTVVLPDRVVEVTTLRRDVATDGRHAVVAFTDRFEEDAARRDFTMNALYLDGHGALYDYVGGRADIEARMVRFIGDAGTRIQEDGLRILRFFRFLATHGQAPADRQAVAACALHKAMMHQLSGERIAHEMRKLLAAPEPGYALGLMAEIGLAPLLTDATWDLSRLRKLLQQDAQHMFQPSIWVRLLVMIPRAQREACAQWIAARWRLSRAERSKLEYLAAPVAMLSAGNIKEALRRVPREWVAAQLLLNLEDYPQLSHGEMLALARTWEIPVFPVTAQDLLARGMVEGVALGKTLRALEEKWAASNYTLTKDALLVY